MSQITTNTYNILPSRLDYFERRMDRIKKAADSKVPPIKFEWTYLPATTIPLDPLLISRAKANLIPDVRQLANGDWVRDVIPVKLEYGELTDAGFEYIGNIRFGQIHDTSTGQIKTGFFPRVVKEIGLTDAEYAQRVAQVAPQLEALASKFQSYGDLNCDHCSLTGDKKERHSVEIVRATKDQKRKGKGGKFTRNLKKGDILQIGTACMEKYSGINVNALAAFYELDRAIGAYGPNGSPQNPAGWGYKEMGVWDFAERMIQYYNQREKEWLAGRRMSLWEVETPDIIYNKGTLAPLMRRKGRTFAKRKIYDANKKVIGTEKYEEGCFVMNVGERLLKGRQFDLYEHDPNKEAKWMFQPFKGQGSVEDMREMWETGINDAREYITVPVVNEVDGSLALDPITGDVLEEEVAIPSSEYIEKMIRKDWKLKIVPIFPPASDSKYVKRSLNRMMDWITNLTPSGKYADLQIRIKQTVKLGYVGDKTKNDFLELWRMFSYANFDARKKADKKAQEKQWKAIGEKTLKVTNPDGEWYKYEDLLTQNVVTYGELIDYLSKIYTGHTSKYQGGSYGSGEIHRAISIPSKWGVVFLSPKQWEDLPDWVSAHRKQVAAQQALQAAKANYEREVRVKRNDQYQLYYQQGVRPSMMQIKYDIPIADFLDYMGWGSMKDPQFMSHATSLFTVKPNGDVNTVYLTPQQNREIHAHFRPKVIGQPQPPGGGALTPPPAPTPSTPTQPVSRGLKSVINPADKRPALPSNDIWVKKKEARRSGNLVGNVGDVLPKVFGWCVVTGKQFVRDGVARRTIQFVDLDNNIYTIWRPMTVSPQPVLGNYYELRDVEITKHTDDPKWGKQNQLKGGSGQYVVLQNATL